MTNQDISASIARIAKTIDLDHHGGVRHFVLTELIKAKIIDAMPESTLDPFRPCPTNWTAFQLAYFDNGVPPPPARQRYTGKGDERRVRVTRTKMHFGGNIKIWTRDQINFSNSKLVSWQANFHCWTASEAKSVCLDLLDEGYIDQGTVDAMDDVIVRGGNNPDLRFSIPLLKTTGTRWMRGHIVVTQLENGVPARFVAKFPNQSHFGNQGAFSTTLPNGQPLKDKAIFQARIARKASFEAWATEIAG